MIAFTSDQWIIIALVFILGMLVGAFLFAGSGRKWKHRYRSEVDRRECNRWATTQRDAMADSSVFNRAVEACLDGRGYTVR